MNQVPLSLPETEALALYRHIHQLPEGEEAYAEAYRQLQRHFFKLLTIEELTRLLESPE